jgi:hypothetical protein
MQDGTVTTESSHGRVGLINLLPIMLHPELGTGVHALQSFDLYVQSCPRSWTNLEDMFVPHIFGFLPPPVDESVLSHGYSRGEESCSVYLADPIAIIEVQGEKVLASILDGDRLRSRGPGVPGVLEL